MIKIIVGIIAFSYCMVTSSNSHPMNHITCIYTCIVHDGCFSFSFGKYVKKVCYRASFDCQFTETFFFYWYDNRLCWLVFSCLWTEADSGILLDTNPPPLPLPEPPSHASLTPTVRIIIMKEAIFTHFRKKIPNYCIFDIINGYSCVTALFHIVQHYSDYLNRRSNIIRCKPSSLSLVTLCKKPLDLLTRGKLLSAVVLYLYVYEFKAW